MVKKCPRIALLKDIATIERRSIQPQHISTGTIYVGLEHITGEGEFINVSPVTNGVLGSSKFIFHEGHILFGKLRPYLKKTARPNFKGICSTDILPILPSKKILKDYLFHFLRLPNTVSKVTTMSSGANLPRISPKLLEQLEVPLPPLDEQKRIAAILDKADAIRRKRQQAMELCNDAIQSAYAHICGPQNPSYAEWKPYSIEEIAAQKRNSMRTGPFGSALKHSEFVDSGIAVLGIDNAVNNFFSWKERRFITPEKYKEMLRYTVFPGDVIITIMGTTGRSAVVPDDVPTAISTKHLATITPNRKLAHPEFLSNAIHRDTYVLRQIAERNKGAIMPGLNMTLIKEIELRVPPLHIQDKFVRFLKHIRKIQHKMTNNSQTEALFSSLQQQAFQGNP